ncbi:MAG TPA: TonB-dependent receptor plug domain-containing protein, partial [Niastella sp.]
MTQRYNVVKGFAMPFMKRRLPLTWLLPLLIQIILAMPVHAQQKNPNIRGLVENEKGEALEGVTVDIKQETGDIKRSVTTDKKGVFALELPADKGAWMFTVSHVGYVTQTIKKEKLDPQKEEAIYVVMKDNANLEVVVVSYGKQRKQEVTGSVVQQDASEMKDMPVGQFAQQLQGKVAGVQVAQNAGTPGRGMEFRIRGAASLSSDNQPLFVVDGIPITGSINNINPSEIETFTILKDAAASALYGSRAANGVVLITTRHAKNGDAKVEINSWYGTQVIPQKGRPDMMTAREFAEFQNEYYEDKLKYEPLTNPTLAAEYKNPERYGDGTNWFNVLTRKAPIQNYDITVSSANGKSSSTVMVGYQAQEGVILNTGTKLYSLRYNQDFNLVNNKLKMGFGIAPSYRIDHNNRLTTEGVGGLIEKIVEASPLIAPIDSAGNMPLNVQSAGMVTNVNPYAQFTKTKDDYKTTRILGSGYVSYELLQGLNVKGYIAMDKGAETRNRYSPGSLVANGIATGVSSSVDNYSWTGEATATYTKTLFNDHHIELLAGYSAQQFEQE